MTNSLAQVEEFAATHPHPHQGGTWNQLCEQFINNSGGFSQAFTTAEKAAKASGHLDPNPATAQLGEIHYWSDAAGEGHDAWQTSRGLLCASNAIPGYLGYISFAAFTKAKPGFTYMGHTFRHGTQTLADISTAGTGNVTPIGNGEVEGMDKPIIERTGASHYFAEFDYATFTWRKIDHPGESYILGQRIAANKVDTWPVSDATMAATYGNWTEVVAPVKPVVGSGSTNLQPVLDQLAAITKLETADQTALIAAINNLPAAVRTKIIAP